MRDMIEGIFTGAGMITWYFLGQWYAERRMVKWIIDSTRLGDERAVKASWDAWNAYRREQRRLRWRKALGKVYSRAR